MVVTVSFHDISHSVVSDDSGSHTRDLRASTAKHDEFDCVCVEKREKIKSRENQLIPVNHHRSTIHAPAVFHIYLLRAICNKTGYSCREITMVQILSVLPRT